MYLDVAVAVDHCMTIAHARSIFGGSVEPSHFES